MKQTRSPLAVPGNALTLAIANPGALGTIDAYISAVNRLPVLTADQETALGRRLRDTGDLDAARELVLSHLRLVVSIARQYLGYGLPHADLIQEGNVGLMKAVKRFDPERGVRLVSFAVHWIKAEIHEYIVRNWRLVKVATTKAQRKLFFNLRSMRPDGKTLDSEQVDEIARELNVRPEDVSEMEVRLSGRDMALESQDDDDEGYAPVRRRAPGADPRAGAQGPRRAAEHRPARRARGPGPALAPYRPGPLAAGRRRRHAARAGAGIRHIRRARPPDRGRRPEEDARHAAARLTGTAGPGRPGPLPGSGES